MLTVYKPSRTSSPKSRYVEKNAIFIYKNPINDWTPKCLSTSSDKPHLDGLF